VVDWAHQPGHHRYLVVSTEATVTPRQGGIIVMDPTRLGVGVIGAGRVGPVIAQALAGAGHRLVGISKPSGAGEDRVSVVVPGVVFLSVPDLVERSELVVIAVPDDELEDLVAGVGQSGGWQSGQIVAHTSIRFGLEVLAPARDRGAIPITLHPLMSFTGTSLDLIRMREAWCVVSAPPVATPIAEALAVEMGMEPLHIAPENRETVAAAIALATTFPSSTIQEAAARLASAGISNPGAVMATLVRSSIENALREVAGNPGEGGGV
jgi:predicted short-subunit dehydrogenase-like oxidoreductase (DUF2520 family)